MGDNLAQLLYEAFRKAQIDPSVLPGWGNVPSEDREAWEAVATKARRVMTAQFVGSIELIAERRIDDGDDVLQALRERWDRP